LRVWLDCSKFCAVEGNIRFLRLELLSVGEGGREKRSAPGLVELGGVGGLWGLLRLGGLRELDAPDLDAGLLYDLEALVATVAAIEYYEGLNAETCEIVSASKAGLGINV